MKTKSVAEIEQIVLGEYSYWKAASEESEDVALIAMGAMGASANILCAIHGLIEPKPVNTKGKTQCRNKSKTTSSPDGPD